MRTTSAALAADLGALANECSGPVGRVHADERMAPGELVAISGCRHCSGDGCYRCAGLGVSVARVTGLAR